MECDSMDLLMMKHMDGAIDMDEAARLECHIRSCEKCREDFILYGEIMRGLPSQTVFAPDNFEKLVMEKIYALPENKKFSFPIDRLLCVVWVVFTALSGLTLLAVMNKDAVIGYISGRPSLNACADALLAVSRFTESAASVFWDLAGSVSASISGYIISSRYMLMLIVAVLAMVQFVIYRKNSAEI